MSTSLYNCLVLPFYAYQFIFIYHFSARTLIVEIIIYMFIMYINHFNHTKYFLSSFRSSGLLHTIFVLFNSSSLYHMQSHKPASRGSPCGILITATNTIKKTVPLYITPRDWEVEKVLFTMWVDQSLGYWYHKTSHSSEPSS